MYYCNRVEHGQRTRSYMLLRFQVVKDQVEKDKLSVLDDVLSLELQPTLHNNDEVLTAILEPTMDLMWNL